MPPLLPDSSITSATPSALILSGLWSVTAGDLEAGRRALARAGSAPGELAEDHGELLTWQKDLLVGLVAAGEERWDAVIARLGPLAARTLTSPWGSRPLNQLVRWTVANAYQRVGRLDSASAHFRAIADWVGFTSDELALRGLTHSFAHQRLVVLYSRMGRLEDARRHWRIFSETFTRPCRGPGFLDKSAA